jgi:ribosome recycling factor
MKNTAPEFIVRIHRPELTPEEREQRMRGIKKAAEAMARSTLQKNEYLPGGKT